MAYKMFISALFILIQFSSVSFAGQKTEFDFTEVNEVIKKFQLDDNVECSKENFSIIVGITKLKKITYQCAGSNTNYKLNIKTKLIRVDNSYKFKVLKYSKSNVNSY